MKRLLFLMLLLALSGCTRKSESAPAQAPEQTEVSATVPDIPFLETARPAVSDPCCRRRD